MADSGHRNPRRSLPPPGTGVSPPWGGASPGSPAPLDACEPGPHPPPISPGARGPRHFPPASSGLFLGGGGRDRASFPPVCFPLPSLPWPLPGRAPPPTPAPRYLRWDLQRRGTGAERAEPQAEVRRRLGCPSGDSGPRRSSEAFSLPRTMAFSISGALPIPENPSSPPKGLSAGPACLFICPLVFHFKPLFVPKPLLICLCMPHPATLREWAA